MLTIPQGREPLVNRDASDTDHRRADSYQRSTLRARSVFQRPSAVVGAAALDQLDRIGPPLIRDDAGAAQVVETTQGVVEVPSREGEPCPRRIDDEERLAVVLPPAAVPNQGDRAASLLAPGERVAEQVVARAVEQGRSQAPLEPEPESMTPCVGSIAAPGRCDRCEPRQNPDGPHQCNRATRARALATTALMIKPYSVIPWPRWLRSRSPSLALRMIDDTS